MTDYPIPTETRTLVDVVTGGDFSAQGNPTHRFWCYALANIDVDQKDTLDRSLAGRIREQTGAPDPSTIEIHASEIWNGSSRARSPFAGLNTRQDAKKFLATLAGDIAIQKLRIPMPKKFGIGYWSIHQSSGEIVLLHNAQYA